MSVCAKIRSLPLEFVADASNLFHGTIVENHGMPAHRTFRLRMLETVRPGRKVGKPETRSREQVDKLEQLGDRLGRAEWRREFPGRVFDIYFTVGICNQPVVRLSRKLPGLLVCCSVNNWTGH